MTHLTPADLDVMEAGLEGVTPGPWEVYDGCSWRRIGTTGARYDDCAVLYPVVADDGHPDLSSRHGDRDRNLAHITRLDPATVRELIRLARIGLDTSTTPASVEQSEGVNSDDLDWDKRPAHFLAAWKTGLPLGLHRVFWKSGGSSLAAIGMLSDGRRWIAPTNWLSPGTEPTAGAWAEIDRTELLFSYPEIEPSPTASVSGGKGDAVFIHITPKPDACAHDFQGWRAFDDGNGGEQVCTKCGMGAMSYTLSLGDLP